MKSYKITTRISKRRLQFASHCKRSEGKIISELVTWRPTQGRRSAGWPTKTFVDLLHQDTGFTSHEIETCIQDRRKAIIGVCQKMSEWVSLVACNFENLPIFWMLMLASLYNIKTITFNSFSLPVGMKVVLYHHSSTLRGLISQILTKMYNSL